VSDSGSSKKEQGAAAASSKLRSSERQTAAARNPATRRPPAHLPTSRSSRASFNITITPRNSCGDSDPLPSVSSSANLAAILSRLTVT
jgi:hypothetical protein